MKDSPMRVFILALLSLSISACTKIEAQKQQHQGEEEPHKIVVTSPARKDVVVTQRYVCQIHSRRHIEVRALVEGYLEEVNIQEGQAVEKGDVLFKIFPPIYQAELEAKKAEAELAQITYENEKKLFNSKIGSAQGDAPGVVSQVAVAKAKAEWDKAKAEVQRAEAELEFTKVKAPYDGIVDRQLEQDGSLVEEGDLLTTLSDNDPMWVYFNVPEARYLEYKTRLDRDPETLKVELVLANGKTFPYPGKIGAIEADFNNETGNLAFRADFPNPDGLLRNGQTGTILIHETLHDAVVIPQLATYDILDKKYVYAVEEPEAKPGAEDGSQNVADEGGEPAGEHGSKQVAALGDWLGLRTILAGDPGSEAGGDHAGKQVAAPSSEHAAEPEAEHHSEHGAEHAGRRGVPHQREIVIQHELEDIFVIKSGLDADDKIVLEGVRHVRDGETFEYEFRKPEEALANLKYHAE